MSPCRKGIIGLKPYFLRIIFPTLKHRVIVKIMRGTKKYLPRPLGRGLTGKPPNWVFNPCLK
jgi:hypothetical protein